MRKLALGIRASALLRKVWALPHMLLITVNALVAVTKHSKITADAVAGADTHMREQTALALRTTAMVGKMHTKRRTLRSRLMRKGASLSSVCTVSL